MHSIIHLPLSHKVNKLYNNKLLTTFEVTVKHSLPTNIESETERRNIEQNAHTHTHTNTHTHTHKKKDDKLHSKDDLKGILTKLLREKSF